MTQAVDTAGGTITDAYDNLDRLTTETTPQGSISYGYDNAGRRTSMAVAGQPQVSYTYDNGDRLTQLTQGSSSVGLSYDNANRRSSLTLPNGVSVSYSYDNDSNITGITYNFGSNTLGNLSYSYDSLGRRTQMGGRFASTGLPVAVSSAAYDVANELTNWNGNPILYDAIGNMQSDGTNAFTWNARNQVATLNSVSLQYDALGRRIKNAAGTSFLYDGPNATQELSGTTPTADIWTGGELFQRSDTNGSVLPLTDALGSVAALADSSGNIQTTYSYDPYGNTTASGATSSNPSQYTGRENEGNGLYYYRARYYSPVLHRFISQDPLAFSGSGPNLYTYAENSPTNLSDASGMAAIGGPGGYYNSIAEENLARRKAAFRAAMARRIGFCWSREMICPEGPTGPIYGQRGLVEEPGLILAAAGGVSVGIELLFGEEAEAGLYLASKAPLQVEPGITQLEGQYINDLGQIQPWRAFYDDYGRIVIRTDYNAGNAAAGIPDVHSAFYQYGPGYSPFRIINHVPGEYMPLGH
jgi:RHS repeat-associated protein